MEFHVFKRAIIIATTYSGQFPRNTKFFFGVMATRACSLRFFFSFGNFFFSFLKKHHSTYAKLLPTTSAMYCVVLLLLCYADSAGCKFINIET